MKLNNKSGFTLLEIIIVVIIVGVLASLALPKLFSTVEFSRSSEALASISSIRTAMDRCSLPQNGDYDGCSDFATELDLEDPGNSPGAHFSYSISPNGTTGYTISALRNGVDNGDGSSTINLTQDTATVTKWGTGAFAGL